MTYKTILVACDGTELAKEAVAQASAIAKAFGSTLSVVTVSEPPPTFASSEVGWSVPASVYEEIHAANSVAAQKIFAGARATSSVPIKDAIHVENSGAAEGIVDTAKKIGADLIVMGSHGYRGLSRLILGSQATKVLTHSSIPVLIVK